ncbi:MAG: glycosyltransferase [Pseudonocardiaceae bacterium]
MSETFAPVGHHRRLPAPILRVAHLIHSLGPGGAENVLVELAAVAHCASLELVIVALSPAPEPVHAHTLRRMGVPVVELGLARWDPRAVPRTVVRLREHRVQLVHTHLKHADLVGVAAGRWLGLPVISTLHVIEDAPARLIDQYKRTAGLLARRRFAACSIAVSTAQREWYRRLSGSEDRLVMLPNGVTDPGPLSAADRTRLRAELGVAADDLLVASASLMRPEKGHHLLLDAVRLLQLKPKLTVALAGDGPMRPQLEARVAGDPALAGRVRFLGYRDDVPALLGAANIVLHTSLADALPTTLIHALAVGVPTVATAVGGIPDIVSAETGHVVTTQPQAIATAIERLAGDRSERERLGAAARMRYLECFEATGWVTRLRSVYESVLEQGVGPTVASSGGGTMLSRVHSATIRVVEPLLELLGDTFPRRL